MNIQGTSKVIAITKDQAQKMKSAYTNQIDAMSLPTEPIAPVTVAPTVEPLTMEDPAMSGVTNADIIGQTPSAPVAPETQPLTTPEAPIVSQDTTQSLAGYPDTSAMSVDELKDGMRIKHPAWEEIWVVRMVGSDFRLVCDEIGIEIGVKDLSEAYPLKEYKQI